jgi:hypothetical protein
MNSEKDVADDYFNSKAFKHELLVYVDAEGKPLWDGSAELFLRSAFAEEIAAHERGFAQGLRDRSADRDDEGGFVVFLLPISDPTDDYNFDDDDVDL